MTPYRWRRRRTPGRRNGCATAVTQLQNERAIARAPLLWSRARVAHPLQLCRPRARGGRCLACTQRGLGRRESGGAGGETPPRGPRSAVAFLSAPRALFDQPLFSSPHSGRTGRRGQDHHPVQAEAGRDCDDDSDNRCVKRKRERLLFRWGGAAPHAHTGVCAGCARPRGSQGQAARGATSPGARRSGEGEERGSHRGSHAHAGGPPSRRAERHAHTQNHSPSPTHTQASTSRPSSTRTSRSPCGTWVARTR